MKRKGWIRRFRDYLALRRTERFFKNLSALGPETLEVIENEWNGIPYKITHRDFKYTPWHLRFTGIELPKYDRICDGPHNDAVRKLFTHLLARVLQKTYGSDPGDFSGPDGRNSTNTTQIPGCVVEDLPHGNTVARATIEAYLEYKDRIDPAIREIERIYEVDPSTCLSREWGPDGPPMEEMTGNYPNSRDLVPRFREEFGLDYLNEQLT